MNDGFELSEPRQTLLYHCPGVQGAVVLPMVSWGNRQSEEPNDRCTEAAAGSGLNVDEPFHAADDKDDWFYFDTEASNVLTVELRNLTPGKDKSWWRPKITRARLFRDWSCEATTDPRRRTRLVPLEGKPARRYYIWVINDGVLGRQRALSVVRARGSIGLTGSPTCSIISHNGAFIRNERRNMDSGQRELIHEPPDSGTISHRGASLTREASLQARSGHVRASHGMRGLFRSIWLKRSSAIFACWAVTWARHAGIGEIDRHQESEMTICTG